MARVEFTANLQRHLPAGSCDVPRETLREALDAIGESWQTISAHLPPIYCVRFVE